MLTDRVEDSLPTSRGCSWFPMGTWAGGLCERLRSVQRTRRGGAGEGSPRPHGAPNAQPPPTAQTLLRGHRLGGHCSKRDRSAYRRHTTRTRASSSARVKHNHTHEAQAAWSRLGLAIRLQAPPLVLRVSEHVFPSGILPVATRGLKCPVGAGPAPPSRVTPWPPGLVLTRCAPKGHAGMTRQVWLPEEMDDGVSEARCPEAGAGRGGDGNPPRAPS